MLQAVFSMQSVPRCYNQDNFRVQLVGTQSPASKVANMEAAEATALGAVTRRQPVKTETT
jgi:hypothetical protein